jgi:hypothetical protein
VGWALCAGLSEEEQHKIAIVEHLEQRNWQIERAPTRERHGRM